jgi:hypothetical protein
MPGDAHRIANERISTCMVKGTFNHRLKFNDIQCKTRASCGTTVLFIDRLDLDRVKGDEGSLPGPLVPKILQWRHVKGRGDANRDISYLYALNCGLF